MRLAAQAKGGFYPVNLEVIHLFASRLDCPVEFTLIDQRRLDKFPSFGCQPGLLNVTDKQLDETGGGRIMQFLATVTYRDGHGMIFEFRSPLERANFVHHELPNYDPEATFVFQECIDLEDAEVHDSWFEGEK